MFYTDDPCADFLRHDREQERALARLPICCRCKEHIQGDVYDFYGELVCEECVSEYVYDNFRQ
jgi:hypothetical protein